MSNWESFYVIVGSSGGALIGLQFVVVTLIAERRHLATPGALSAFGTPTVVHFSGALIISAIMSAPWPSLAMLWAALCACGVCGLGYGAFVIRRARQQTDYEPVLEDWFWYAFLPCTAYAMLAVAAFFLPTHAQTSAFFIAAAALGLLLIGIHNAWDSVTHIVMTAAKNDAVTGNGDD